MTLQVKPVTHITICKGDVEVYDDNAPEGYQAFYVNKEEIIPLALALLKEAGAKVYCKEQLHSDIQYLINSDEYLAVIPKEGK